MSFDFNQCLQAEHAIEGLKYAQYKFIRDKAKKTDWIRLAAPLVALSAAILGVALVVSSVIEPIIKGLANIFGALFSEKCNLKRGLKQITNGVVDGVFGAAFWSFLTIAEVTAATLGVAIVPKECAEVIMKQLRP